MTIFYGVACILSLLFLIGYFFVNKVVFLRWTGWKFYRKIILSGIWRQLGNGGGIQSLSTFGGVIDAVEF